MAAGSSARSALVMTDLLNDYPVNPAEAGQSVRPAQKAVVIHVPEDWPGGRLCRNCHERWPCRLARWGVGVLRAAGWTSADVAQLVERAKAGEQPW